MDDFSSGLDEIFANMETQNRELSEKVDAAIQGGGIVCAAETKKLCPVGTPESTGIKGYIGGRLRSSYQYEREGFCKSKVSTNVSYGPDVELGTYKMRARPHLFPGFLSGVKSIEEELKSI